MRLKTVVFSILLLLITTVTFALDVPSSARSKSAITRAPEGFYFVPPKPYEPLPMFLSLISGMFLSRI